MENEPLAARVWRDRAESLEAELRSVMRGVATLCVVLVLAGVAMAIWDGRSYGLAVAIFSAASYAWIRDW